MTESLNIRALALDILIEVNERDQYSHLMLRQVLDKYQYLEKQKRAFLTRLVEGTLEHMLELDYLINACSKIKVRKMKPFIRNLLRISVYQLKYMDSIPDSAVCNEAVKLAKKRGFSQLSGFVNGVLRGIARNLPDISYPDSKEEPLSYLEVRYSVPQWIISQWVEAYGVEETEEILKAFLQERPVTIRTNTLKCTPEELKERLKKEGVQVEGISALDYAFAIRGVDYLNGLGSFQDGWFYVQDISSMMVVETAKESLINPAQQKSDSGRIYVIDVCAAPGGKSTHMAEYLGTGGIVEARDLTGYKVSLIEENIARHELTNMRAVCMDAAILDKDSIGKADILICDLPCSGLGVMGRKTDIRYKMTPEKQRDLVQLQRNILNTVCAYVKPGGILIYSTCTIHREENEGNVHWFLQQHPDFSLVSQEQMLPGKGYNDGFFIAKLVRNSMADKRDIKSMNLAELTSYLTELGEKAFRGKQIYEWIHVKRVDEFAEMSNISKKLKEKLINNSYITSLKKEQVQISQADGTRKYLFLLEDGNVIESVFMRYKHGNSVCISSQVGCRMGCRFCASTLDGLVRGLTPAEMLDQIYQIGKDTGERISNVVVMGTGEPLDNFDNLIRFLELLTDENGMHMSQRNVTVSTCGIVPRMKELADQRLSITLALSLHASSQEKRKELMPVANAYDIHEVIDACRYYFQQTGRRVTFEYSLVGGINDTQEDADGLSKLIAGLNCHVNLIPVNPIKERDYIQSNIKVINAFKNKLEKNGINVTIRREMGRDIDGACGQLRKRYIERK